MSQFSQKLFKVESSTLANICRLSDCIIELRLRLIAIILQILAIFSFSPFCMITLKIVSEFSQVVLELESWILVFIWMMSCDKV